MKSKSKRKVFDVGAIPNEGMEWEGGGVVVKILGADKKPLKVAATKEQVERFNKFAKRASHLPIKNPNRAAKKESDGGKKK